MSKWTKTKITVPIEYVRLANRLANLFDFDSGGYNTFGSVECSADGKHPATHYFADTNIKTKYYEILKDPVSMFYAMQKLSQIYGTVPPTQEEINTFCDVVILGETNFKKIIDNG